MWNDIQSTFKEYVHAKGERLYQRNIEGTIRGLAYSGQISFVRSHFKKLMQSAFRKRALKPHSKQQLNKLNETLTATYKNDVKSYVNMYTSFASGTDISPEQKRQYEADISAYKSKAQKSKTLWQHLRHLCGDLASSVYGDTDKSVSWRVSMEFALSKNRILAIKNDPVGPDEQ